MMLLGNETGCRILFICLSNMRAMQQQDIV